MFDDIEVRRPRREDTPLSGTKEKCANCKWFVPSKYAKADEYGECYVAPPAGNQIVLSLTHVVNLMDKQKNPGAQYPALDLRDMQLRPRTRGIDFCSMWESTK